MKFSNKAYKYLDKLKRDDSCIVMDRNNVVEYFVKQNIPVFEKVIDFQMDYSGLEMTIFNKPSSTFKARLFSKSDISSNAEIEVIKIDGQFYFYCGHHKTAQFWFVLSEGGNLCTYDNNEETVNVTFSSFEKFIETYAFEDILSRDEKYEHLPYYDVIDQTGFDNLTEKFVRHTTANDYYNSWRSNEHLMIYQGVWLDRPASFIHLYADNKMNCEAFTQKLKELQIIA